MSKGRASRRERFYSTLIILLSCCALILILAIIVDSRMSQPAEQTLHASVTEQSSATAAPLMLSLPATPAPTQETVVSTVATEKPVYEAPDFEFLPIYTRAETNEKVIAVTVDDCSHLDNLRGMLVACQQTGVKLTLFPLGQAVMKNGMSDILKLCVSEFGHEVENRTWSNQPLYQIDDASLASEIWTADMAVDYVLGADYDMHFFRMRGGSGTRDARTHAYLKQLGYDAVVTWTEAANESTLDELYQSLAPGNIYLFSTTSADLEKMAQFIPYAQKMGYRFVTLNELLGYETNAVTPTTDNLLARTLPALEGYSPVYTEQKLGDRTRQVYLIQQRLGELGYLGLDEADGMFGYGTSSALSEFQANNNLLGTGVASTETQYVLFSEGAVRKPSQDLFN